MAAECVIAGEMEFGQRVERRRLSRDGTHHVVLHATPQFWIVGLNQRVVEVLIALSEFDIGELGTLTDEGNAVDTR